MIKSNVINKAIKIAKSSSVIQGKIGAVLFTNNGHIITFACNVKCYGNSQKNTIHAEEYVLAKAIKLNVFHRFKNKGLNMLIIRYKPSTQLLANARPCIKCQKLLKRFRDIQIYYSNKKGKIVKYERKFNEYNSSA